MGKLTLIIGGARSGKSTHAQRLAEQHGGQVVFLATATAGDDEMSARIKKHQQERPTGWVTREIPHGVAAAVAAAPVQAEVVLLDCLTLLVSNVTLLGMDDFDHPDELAAANRVEEEISGLISTIKKSPADWIIVTNEVGLGLVPPFPVGRIYRDLLGRANQRIAAQADEVYWLVAGIPVPIHGFRENCLQSP
ncbi:MAG: bifunctional adenosylcobinamide kinase/adenosylcobinamide-phosphate guanylyltransferase [Anaerolineaceae bacterium]